MKQEDVLKALEDVTAIVAGLTTNVTTISLAIMLIKGMIGMVVGQTLDAPEYAAAIQRGMDRNKTAIQNRLDTLPSQ